MIRASLFYARLLLLYPRAHREAFGEQMQRTFDDSYRNAPSVGLAFWLAVLWDEFRSIAYEHTTGAQGRRNLNRTQIGLMLAWPVLSLILPWLLPRLPWPLTLVAVGALGALVLTRSGTHGTVLVSIAIVAMTLAIGADRRDIPDVIGPAVVVAFMLLSIRVTQVDLGAAAFIGGVGAFGLALATSTQADFDPIPRFIFYGVVTLVCGVSAFRSGRRLPNLVIAWRAGLSTLLLGAAIWVAARAALFEVATRTNLLGPHDATSASYMLTAWQGSMGSVLFINAVFCIAAGVLGQVVRDADQELATPSGSSESR